MLPFNSHLRSGIPPTRRESPMQFDMSEICFHPIALEECNFSKMIHNTPKAYVLHRLGESSGLWIHVSSQEDADS